MFASRISWHSSNLLVLDYVMIAALNQVGYFWLFFMHKTRQNGESANCLGWGPMITRYVKKNSYSRCHRLFPRNFWWSVLAVTFEDGTDGAVISGHQENHDALFQIFNILLIFMEIASLMPFNKLKFQMQTGERRWTLPRYRQFCPHFSPVRSSLPL